MTLTLPLCRQGESVADLGTNPKDELTARLSVERLPACEGGRPVWIVSVMVFTEQNGSQPTTLYAVKSDTNPLRCL